MPHTSTYLRTFKRGDYVDIKVDSSIHKGMPFKYYHGRTGRVWNVTRRAIGVEINKVHRQRQIVKRGCVANEQVELPRRRRADREEARALGRKGEPVRIEQRAVQLRREPRGAVRLDHREHLLVEPALAGAGRRVDAEDAVGHVELARDREGQA